MAEHIRTLQGFKSQTDPQIVATAGAVLQGMTGNTAFPSPPVDLKALQAAFDDLNAAIGAGGTPSPDKTPGCSPIRDP